MKKVSPKIVFPLVCAALISSCKPDTNFDDTPFLEYRSLEIVPDSDPTSNRISVIHELYFTDGDGDIGTSEKADSGSTCAERLALNNLFVRIFRKTGGSFIEVLPPDTCFPYSASIPDITPTGSNPTLEGNIFYEFDPTFSFSSDSMKFEFILTDRTGNQSNVAFTPALLIEAP